MDGKTMEEVRKVLLERWKGLVKSDEGRVQLNGEDTGMHQAEIIDIAQSLEQLGREVSLAEQERRELVAIERALAKIAAGSFGICEDCGEEILARRLMVLPHARLCANCQAFEEHQNARVRVAGANMRGM